VARSRPEPPPAVTAATSAYREENDPVGKFLKECTTKAESRVKASRLYEVYRRWCSVNGHHALSNTKFGLQLNGKKIETIRSDGTWYLGLAFDIGAVAEVERKPVRNPSDDPSDDGGDPRDSEGYP
jgi:phage/plasmid-associated DNA primase